MQKDEVAGVLREMADLLEITDANKFEYLAFRNAAAGLEDWAGDLKSAVATSSVTEIPSVGKGIASVISELVETGRSDERDRIRGLVPEALPRLLRFRGLGPKRVRTLWKDLGVESPDDLECAAREGRVLELKGFGPKMVEKILDSARYFRDNNRPGKPAPDLNAVPAARHSDGKIFAGMSGFSYPKWKGSFYPADARTGDLLQHYARKLATVEINNTFYRFPTEPVVDQWKTQTPEDFQFALKAHRRVTHQMKLSPGTGVRIQEFVQRCSVLGSRLGCILFQLPPDFERDDSRLATLLDSLPDGPRFAVEFRHSSWAADDVHRRLRDHNVACVSGDADSAPSQKFVTADFIYVRLRKPKYSPKELNDWGDWFTAQSAENRDVLAYLKHDETGDAPNEVANRWSP